MINFWLKILNVKLIRYQFWGTRCAFRLIKYLQHCDAQSEKVGNPKNVKSVKEPEKNPKKQTVSWNWAKFVEGMHEGDNPSFWDEFEKNVIFFIFVF
jgi:hypothetical protein